MSERYWTEYEYQVYQPSVQAPYAFSKDVNGILYFPDANIDIAEVHVAIKVVDPYIVVPAEGDTFDRGTLYAHIVRDDASYHTGIIVPGMYDQLVKHIKWAVARGFEPIIMRPNNFYRGVGNQDKTLWQMQQQGVWVSGAWYHLATGKPHELRLPGKWTVSADFVEAHGARK
jgi:hypothetical protein